MEMIKYKASSASCTITKLDVVRETSKCVVLAHSRGEYREAKESEYFAYLDSFEHAKSWLAKKYAIEVQRAECVLKRHELSLEKALSLEPPSDD